MNNQYTPTERLGVNAVEKVFLRSNWIFREQHATDVGIDAQAEVYENGLASGRALALQIKSGVSYFSERNSLGFVFRGELKHLKYWTEHSLPVILVLYHPDEDKAWWCAIKDNPSIAQTPKGWSVLVPHAQALSAPVTALLRNMAMPDFVTHARLRDIGARLMAEDGSRFALLIDALQMSADRIDVVSPYLDDMLFLVLALCSHKGQVRLVTGQDVPEAALNEFFTGDHAGLEWKRCAGLHDRKIIIDGHLAILSMANLSRAGWRTNTEAVFASTDPAIVSDAAEAFERLWDHSAVIATNSAAE
jgi:hypothetical protein